MENYKIEYPIHKKWSMGKYLRTLKQLRKPQPNSSIIAPSPQQKALLTHLEKNDFKSSKVAIGNFSLKNGLCYSGLIVTDDLSTNEIFFRVPKNLILDARTAYNSEINIIFQENEAEFRVEDGICDDYLLIFYILFENQKGKNSKWFHTISAFPKNQGFLALWKSKDLEYLEEGALKRKAKKQYSEILQEHEKFQKIAMRYPHFFKPNSFSFEDFIWIYSILTNRSFFGNYKTVTLIPFVDMLNHENVNIYRNHPNNTIDEVLDINDHKILNESEENNFTSSDESWGEKDSDEVSDGNALILNGEREKLFFENILINSLISYFEENLSYKDTTSVLFLGVLIEYVQENQEENHEFKGKVMLWMNEYLNSIKEFYSKDLKIDYMNFYSIKENKKMEGFDRFLEPLDFEEIQFITNENENYKKNSQISLNYGDYSNKKLLKIYGMSIEYNLADKVFLNISLCSFFKASANFLNYLHNSNLYPFIKQFKLKYTTFDSSNLIIFFKVLSYDFVKNKIIQIFLSKDIDLEIKALEKIIGVLNNLSFSKNSIEENEKMLFDKNIGYNQYFSIVYKLGKQRITQMNIKLYKICLLMLEKIKGGLPKLVAFMEKINELESEEEYPRFRYLLSPYMKKWDF